MKRENNKKFKKRRRNQKRSLTCRVLSMMFAIVLFSSTVLINTDYVSQASSFDDMVDMVEVEEDSAAVDTSEDTGDDLDTDVNFESEEGSAETYSESDDFGSSDADFSSGENMFTDGTSESSTPAEEAAQPVSCIVNLKNETIEIKAEAPAGVLPNGTQMTVKAVENNTEDAELTDQYNKLAAKITEQLQSQGKNLDGFLAYNVSFTDADGNPVEPSDKVTYSFTYKEASSPELTDPAASTVTAAMIRTNKETSELELTELKAEEDKLTVETNENKQLTKAAFQSAATAAYTFVWSSTPAADDNENNENKVENGEVNNEEVNTDTNTENTEENGEETPDQEQTKMIRIIADEVNLRVAPSTEAEAIATVNTDTQLPLLETVTGEDEFTWYKVSYNETEAYVRSDMAEVVETEEQDVNVEEQTPAEITRYDYESDEVNVKVTLTNPEDLPDEAELSVTPVEISQEAEEQITQEAIEQKKAIENIRAYDIKFLLDGEEIQPGETVKVEVSFPEEETTEDADVYHVDENENVENMNGSVNKEGNVEFDTPHFSTYVIVGNKRDDKITVTIEHYDATSSSETEDQYKKIYADDEKELKIGQKIDCKKATNWEITSVKVVLSDGTERTAEPGDIVLAQNATVKVYYTPTTGTFAGAPTFYDYTVKAGEATTGTGKTYYSINMEDNYVDKTSKRFAVGCNDNYDVYKEKLYYWTDVNKQSVNGWNGANAKAITGLVTGLDADKRVTFSCAEPGLFDNTDKKVTVDNTERYLRRVYKDYTLNFTRIGDTYLLSGIKDGEKNDVTGNYNGSTGYNFFPLDDVAVSYEGAKKSVKAGDTSDVNVVAGNHNYYFGMRYDVNFSIGDYIGPLNYVFKGDDDMWVLLDGKDVVIDLGGVHNAMESTVDLWDYLDEGDTTTHTLTVLYMERGAGASNCYMNFTLPNATISQVTTDALGTLNFQKVKSDKTTGLSKAKFALYSDIDCTTLIATATSGKDGNVQFDKLREGTYYLKETQAPDGYVGSDEVWTVTVTKESDTSVKVELKDSAGNAVENKKIVNQTQEEIIKSRMDYNKTAKVKDWDQRTYDITITASSKITSSSVTEKTSAADIMMVFDMSGSMNEEGSLSDVGQFDNVKDSLDKTKVYYYNTSRNTTRVSNNTYYSNPMIYLDGKWQYYNGSDWKEPSSSDVSYWDWGWKSTYGKVSTWNSRITTLKEAAIAFIKDTAVKSSDSKIGITTFDGYKNDNKNYTRGNVIQSITTVGSSPSDMIKAVAKITADGGTSPQKGLDKANEQLEKVSNDKLEKYIILFTDGVPSKENDTLETEEKIKTLNSKAKIFTVALCSNNEDVPGSDKNNIEWMKSLATDEKHAFNTSTASGLGSIFKTIQESITHNVDITNATITDVIDSRFAIINDTTTPNTIITDADLADNKTVTLKNGGVVSLNGEGNQVVTWSEQTIPYLNKKKDNAWSRQITVRAKDEYIGGNNIPTNVYPDSKISTGYGDAILPQPTVNVKSDLLVNNKEVTIFYGDQIPTGDSIVNKLFNKAEPEGYVTQLDGTPKTVTYTIGSDGKNLKNEKGQLVNPNDFTLKWYSNDACTEEIADLASVALSSDSPQYYYLKVTYNKLGKATPDSNDHTTKDGKPYISGDSSGNTGTGSITAYNSNDSNKKYGVYTVKVISGQIQITKELEEHPESTKEFKFEVTKEKDATFKKELTISVDANSKVAGPQILDKLKRGTYHVREVLPEGSEYKVSSAEIGKATNCENVRPESSTYVATFKLGYKKNMTDENVITAEYTYDDKNPSGTIGAVKYTNTEIKATLDLKKTDEKQNNPTYLDGAYFKLEKKSGENWGPVENYDKFSVGNKDTDIELNDLRNGDYRLTEVTAPSGYMLLSSPICFTVSNGTVTLTDEGTVSNMCELTTESTNPPVLTIKNQKLYSLPESGGNGIYWYMIGGMVLMSTAAWILYKNKCREVLGK